MLGPAWRIRRPWIQVAFFIISKAGALPAWLAGIRLRQPGVRTLKTWPCLPTVNTSRLLTLKSAFTPSAGWPNWEGGWSERPLPRRLCHLFPRPPASGCADPTASAQVTSRAKS